MKTGTPKNTLLVISTGFLALHVFLFWPWAVYVALGVGCIGIISDSLSQRIEQGWMNIAHILGCIVPRVILTLLFFLFLCPLALLSRLFTKDPLMLSRRYPSYFIDVNRAMDKPSFEKMW
ncbi:MAG: SxtJ family membrane protein [Candidatus Omnitrophica bacterium]|nr:SxtJ family membrane protein [Candidatus Omnitrophota bacterium]